jgi:hypothetical protein
MNRRVRVVDVYRIAPRFEFTDTLSDQWPGPRKTAFKKNRCDAGVIAR